MKIIEALVEVMRSVPVVRKEERNQAQNFNFRGIDATLNAVGPALRKHGVVAAPYVLEHSAETVTVGRAQTSMQFATLLVQYTFYGPEGDTLQVVVPGQAMDSGDRAYSKAMSVAFRTALLQTLALPTDERDPDADSYETVDPVVVAKAALRAKIKTLGLDGKAVAAQYLETYGNDVSDETDAERITNFTAQF